MTHAPLSPIVVAGLALEFGVALLIGVGALAQLWNNDEVGRGQRILYFVYGLVAAAITGAFWYRVYQNFCRQTKRGGKR